MNTPNHQRLGLEEITSANLVLFVQVRGESKLAVGRANQGRKFETVMAELLIRKI